MERKRKREINFVVKRNFVEPTISFKLQNKNFFRIPAKRKGFLFSFFPLFISSSRNFFWPSSVKVCCPVNSSLPHLLELPNFWPRFFFQILCAGHSIATSGGRGGKSPLCLPLCLKAPRLKLEREREGSIVTKTQNQVFALKMMKKRTPKRKRKLIRTKSNQNTRADTQTERQKTKLGIKF